VTERDQVSSYDLSELFERLGRGERSLADAPETLLTVYARLQVIREPRGGRRVVTLDLAHVDAPTAQAASLDRAFLSLPYERSEYTRLSPEQVDHLLGRGLRFAAPSVEPRDLHWTIARRRARELGIGRKQQAASFDSYRAKLIVVEYPNINARFQEVPKVESLEDGGRGRGRKRVRCAVCKHEARKDINALLDANKPWRTVAHAFDLEETALADHIAHRTRFRWTSAAMGSEDLERYYLGVRWARASGVAKGEVYELVAAAFEEKIPARFGGKDREGALRRLYKRGRRVHQGHDPHGRRR
jgi:hypothetical protein